MNLSEVLSKILTYIASGALMFLAPIKSLIVITVVFVMIDFITGNIACYKRSHRAGKKYVFKSELAWNTIWKLIGVSVGLSLFFTLESSVIGLDDLLVTRGLTTLICGAELWSWLENMSDISNSGIFKLIQKFIGNKVQEHTGVDINEQNIKKHGTN